MSASRSISDIVLQRIESGEESADVIGERGRCNSGRWGVVKPDGASPVTQVENLFHSGVRPDEAGEV